MFKNPWLRYGVDAWRLGVEASAVIALRSFKIAAGGMAAEAETVRMFQEKIDAAAILQIRVVTGDLGFSSQTAAAKTLAHFRRKVRANRRRLLKG